MESVFPKFLKPQKVYRSLLLTLPHKVASLKQTLDIFAKHNINLSKIESRPSKFNKLKYDFIVDVDETADRSTVEVAINEMLNNSVCEQAKFLGFETKIPWFPRKISEIDYFTRKTLEAGGDLEADHPGFLDKEYRERRKMIAEIAHNYKHGESIPRINYTKAENETWKIIYDKLSGLRHYACEQYNYLFPLFEQNCGLRDDSIPQLQDVSDFLTECTGWKLRPVSGLLTARDFLNALAFRVFHSTQYIRHHSKPYYTPEPDIVHELIGHVVMLADPDFADFSQQIGLASLGASDEEIDRLVRLYWYTLEFGLVREKNRETGKLELKAYGAGLLSSFGEMEYSCTGIDKETGKQCEYRAFVPEEAAERSYPITHYQPMYYVVESIESCKDLIKRYVNSQLQRPFTVKYNPYTNTVDVLDSQEKLITLTNNIQNNLDLLKTTLRKLGDGNELDFQSLQK
ncbi:hypothetical protein ABK040_002567 [Willaertia magna]